METEEKNPNKPRIKLARDKARKILDQCKISSYPILLREISSQIEGLRVDGKEFENGISGVHLMHEGTIFIAYNKKHPKVRNRFTIAHELGHALMRHTIDFSPMDLDSKDYKEAEANQFAAELLMPLKMLKKAIEKSKTVDKLAFDFWVSKKAMGWRVMNTGLFKFLSSWT